MSNFSIKKLNGFKNALLRIRDRAGLCNLLYISYEQLFNSIENAPYHSFHIPKKKGNARLITAPESKLLMDQQRLNLFLQSVYYFHRPPCVHGFVIAAEDDAESLNILTNAKAHLKSPYLLNMDLKDFFPSISTPRIVQLLQSPPFSYNRELAAIIALLCTYEKKLPTGAPTSPVLANFAFRETDSILIDFSKTHNLTYTRYADDLTFSSESPITEETIKKIEEIIHSNGFVVNAEKTRLQTRYDRQTVTGIIVNEKLNINRRYIRNIRAILYDLSTNGIDKSVKKYFGIDECDEIFVHKFICSVAGKIEWIEQVKGTSNPTYEWFRDNFVKTKSGILF